MSGRAVQAFLPVEPPTVTHNDLVAYVVYGPDDKPMAAIRRSDRLMEAEAALLAQVGRHVPDEALSGPLRVQVRLCFGTRGRHDQGEPHVGKPDLDNFLKGFLDCLTRARVIEDDRMVCELRASKAWADPAGVWLRVEEIERDR